MLGDEWLTQSLDADLFDYPSTRIPAADWRCARSQPSTQNRLPILPRIWHSHALPKDNRYRRLKPPTPPPIAMSAVTTPAISRRSRFPGNSRCGSPEPISWNRKFADPIELPGRSPCASSRIHHQVAQGTTRCRGMAGRDVGAIARCGTRRACDGCAHRRHESIEPLRRARLQLVRERLAAGSESVNSTGHGPASVGVLGKGGAVQAAELDAATRSNDRDFSRSFLRHFERQCMSDSADREIGQCHRTGSSVRRPSGTRMA
jgi:hypothetical protein